MDWGSSYPQRALHNLTYGPIAGRGPLIATTMPHARGFDPGCRDQPETREQMLPMTKTVATSDYPPLIAPSGARPSVTKRQIAIKSLRAKATIVMRRI